MRLQTMARRPVIRPTQTCNRAVMQTLSMNHKIRRSFRTCKEDILDLNKKVDAGIDLEVHNSGKGKEENTTYSL